MKKILFTIAVMLGLTTGATAQKDGFLFNDWSDFDNRDRNDLELPVLPDHALNGNQDAAPLGGGLLVLTALGAGYAALRRREDR
ncbi:MAG: hypothetical protein MJZ85_08365 [Bacteroidales bacterium]|nr:hypothetical protein [Bacteroidales bacterium]